MKNKINVSLIQISNTFSDNNYLPYTVGLLQSYTQKMSKVRDRLNFNSIVYKRGDISEIVDHIKECDIAGFSVYMWNIKYSLKIASELKKVNPECLIVFGGPQVPDKAYNFLNENKFVDIAVHGEGEEVFTQILNNLETRKFENIEAISYLNDNNLLVSKPRGNRLKDLNIIPSPYLSGVFNELIRENVDEKWIVMWETNRGCPFSCTFCDWGSSVLSKVNRFDIERLYEEVKWFSKNKIEYISCCDSNFGILPRDVEIARYIAEVKLKEGYPFIFSVQSTKNAPERVHAIQKILAGSGLSKGTTIAMQSMDQATLKNIKRDNIPAEQFQKLQREFTRDKIETYTDMIIALPGETYESFIDGIDLIVENSQHNRIQFVNLAVLPNAAMGDPEYQKKYGMKLVTSKIVTNHSSLFSGKGDFVQELQQLVIATDSMPLEDWVRTRAYCYMVSLLYFDKILQIPLAISKQMSKIKLKEFFAAFTSENFLKNYPTLHETYDFFYNKARDIQNGSGVEYCASFEWLNIWWSVDEYIFIKLVVENKINDFYEEAGKVIGSVLKQHKSSLPENLLEESVALNKILLKMPFKSCDDVIDVSYNVFEMYRGIIMGEPIGLEKEELCYLIKKSKNIYAKWDDWYREVVFYGNRKGSYMHEIASIEYKTNF